MSHIDTWLDTKPVSNDAERHAKACFEVFRLPAMDRFALPDDQRYPLLFCTFEGARYRVTGASCLGDIWLTADFEQQDGYQKRVDVDDCSDWSAIP